MKTSKQKKKTNEKLYIILGLLFVFFVSVDFVLFAINNLSQPRGEESTVAEITTEENTVKVDKKTNFVTSENHTYCYPKGYPGNYQTGWLQINDKTYYFGTDGVMCTGWNTIEQEDYFFDENGLMVTSQWIDNRYVNEDGEMLRSTMTPDNHYVDVSGKKDDIVSLAHSKKGLTDLQKIIQEMVDEYSGTWSVYVKNIDTNEYMIVNDEPQYTASLIKLFCAAAIYDLVEKGELEWDDNIDRLMTNMISISDNDAFNLLVRKCDTENNNHVAGRAVIQKYIDENGYKNTTITSALYPTAYPAPSSPGRNYTTTADCGLILEKIYKKQVVTPEASEDFLNLMLNQQRTQKIPAGLPEGIKCANKTGETDSTQHDAAIIYSPNTTYILVVMSTNCGAAIGNIQNISKVTYDYFNPESDRLLIEEVVAE